MDEQSRVVGRSPKAVDHTAVCHLGPDRATPKASEAGRNSRGVPVQLPTADCQFLLWPGISRLSFLGQKVAAIKKGQIGPAFY